MWKQSAADLEDGQEDLCGALTLSAVGTSRRAGVDHAQGYWPGNAVHSRSHYPFPVVLTILIEGEVFRVFIGSPFNAV